MNARQERFCLEYAASGNASKAAEAAGYSPRSARSIGQRLLTKDDIAARIRSITEEINAGRIAEIADIQAFWTEIFKDGTQKTADRLKASELLARSKGGFTSAGSEGNADTEDVSDVIIYVPDNNMRNREG